MECSMKRKVVILKLGGSQINPGKLNIPFLNKFKKLIQVRLGRYKFVIITGGGSVCRTYNEAASQLGITEEDMDRMGIEFTRVHGELIRAMFGGLAFKYIWFDYSNPPEFENILVCTGWKPGHSTNYDAVKWAEAYGASHIINLTNVAYIYDKNPMLHKGATPFKKLSISEYLKIVGKRFTPGMNTPFDPEAAKALPNNTKVIVLKGLDNLKAVLDKRPYEGSLLSH